MADIEKSLRRDINRWQYPQGNLSSHQLQNLIAESVESVLKSDIAVDDGAGSELGKLLEIRRTVAPHTVHRRTFDNGVVIK